jgi:hypothetical protein
MISNLRFLCGIISWELSEPYTNQGGRSIPTTNVSYVIGVSCLMDIAWGLQKLGLILESKVVQKLSLEKLFLTIFFLDSIFEPLLKENNTK